VPDVYLIITIKPVSSYSRFHGQIRRIDIMVGGGTRGITSSNYDGVLAGRERRGPKAS
jgi:hypothetical protein